MSAPLGQLSSLSNSLTQVRRGANDAAPFLSLNSPEILTVSEITPTRLEIPRADPADGDVLDIAAQVFRRQEGTTNEKLIYEEHRSVTLHFYGWHSGLSSGLVFVRAAKANQSNFKPEAAAVWRIGYTPRPGDKTSLGTLRPGVGFHATTLHFNSTVGSATEASSSNNLQFGVGLSLHLLGDIIQTGYGWNLGVPRERGYSYVGIGIMKVLRQLLSQRQTTP